MSQLQEECEWISQILGTDVRNADDIRSGALLCLVMDKVLPGSIAATFVKRAQSAAPAAPFVQREMIAAFLGAAKKAGVPDHELFETEDLYDARDLAVVGRALRSLSRQLHSKNEAIPLIGPNLAQRHQPPAKFSGEKYAGWSIHQYGPMQSMIDGAAKLRKATKEREELIEEQNPSDDQSGAPKKPPAVPPKPSHLRSSR